MISGLYTTKAFDNAPGWQVAQEWEEDFATYFNVQLKPYGAKVYGEMGKLLAAGDTTALANFRQDLHNPLFCFLYTFYDLTYFSLTKQNNVVPLAMDYWLNDAPALAQHCPTLKLAFSISLQMVQHTRRNYPQIGLEYLPMMLSNRWLTMPVVHKDIDVIQIGRLNPFLHNCMLAYTKQNPSVSYVYKQNIDGKVVYVNTAGSNPGPLPNRQQYMQLLARAKVSLVSTVGMDNDSRDTGGVNPVTARFLESAAANCRMLGRYPLNADFIYFDMPTYCPRVNTQVEFNALLDKALGQVALPANHYQQFLQKHSTSTRAKQVARILNSVIK